MGLGKEFEDFCSDLFMDDEETEEWNNRIKKITKRLNIKYYENNDSDCEHMLIVGSVGRETALHKVSDYDCIFELPSSKYKQFNEHSGNGQSALLQEVKNEIKLLYPSTKVKGDGQVVVISFNFGDIEFVPAFKQNDDSFKYPDSNNGGTWKITKPIPEIDESIKMNVDSNGTFVDFSHLMRRWKNQVGFKFKGLLIDTFVKKFIDKQENRLSLSFSDYYSELIELMKYLSEQDEEASYWYALGSNQQIYNDDSGKFIKKAKKAYNKIKDINEDSDEAIVELRKLLGKDFAKGVETVAKSSYYVAKAENEEFIEEKFSSVNIMYNLKVDYTVTQNGFRPKRMRYFIQNRLKLKANKKLDFVIEETDIPDYMEKEVSWYWKVRNVGSEAVKRGQERGEIIQGGKTISESTSFSGDHFVECFAVYNNIVIAKGRVKVPIDTYFGKD